MQSISNDGLGRLAEHEETLIKAVIDGGSQVVPETDTLDQRSSHERFLAMCGDRSNINGQEVFKPLLTHQGRVVPYDKFSRDLYPIPLVSERVIPKFTSQESYPMSYDFFAENYQKHERVTVWHNGILAAPSSYLCDRVAVEIPEGTPEDYRRLRDHGGFLKIMLDSSKGVTDFPLDLFANTAPDGYRLGIPFFIPANTCLNVQLSFTSPLPREMTFRVILDGLLSRACF